MIFTTGYLHLHILKYSLREILYGPGSTSGTASIDVNGDVINKDDLIKQAEIGFIKY